MDTYSFLPALSLVTLLIVAAAAAFQFMRVRRSQRKRGDPYRAGNPDR